MSWDHGFLFKRQYPVISQPSDEPLRMSIQRILWSWELHELRTGEKEKRRLRIHKKKMAYARRLRKQQWRPEWAYE